jgi:hypothetical protein
MEYTKISPIIEQERKNLLKLLASVETRDYYYLNRKLLLLVKYAGPTL